MSNDLKRTLDLKDSISVTAGSMIGCGIFIVSSDIARLTDSAFFLILVWIIAGLFSLSGAISYAEPVLNIKEDGGQYIFLKKMFNNLTAFLYGWSLLLVIQTATIAAVCIAVGKFLGILFPSVSSSLYLINTPYIHISTQQFCAVIVCFILTYINSKGIKYGVITQNIFTAAKVLSIIGIIIFGIFFGCNYEIIISNFHPLSDIAGMTFDKIEIISAATVGAIFAMVTWNNITFISGEVRNPEKNIPKALFWGVILVIILYLLINVIYTCSIPLEQIKNAPEDIVAVAMIQNITGNAGKSVIALIIMISAIGSANGLIMTGARVYYQMAKDRLLFRNLAKIDRKTKVPVNSLILQCLWACLFILFCGNYMQLLDYVIYAALIFYVLTVIGIYVYRFKHRTENITKVNNIFSIFFILTGSCIIYSLSVCKTISSIKTIGIILAGIPVYLIWEKIKLQKTCTK
ncbi:MAG: amino acid permease [Candidatus Gastranaerophilales bacterium]|nr:amino acid permease [Candidatus Gastranaerophilales bacterium]